MFRLVLSIILVVAFAGATTASATHGFDHGMDHAEHHAEMTKDDLMADAGNALAHCCDTAGGVGSTSCFADLATMSAIVPDSPASGMAIGLLYADFDFSNLTLSVPTGPPKV